MTDRPPPPPPPDTVSLEEVDRRYRRLDPRRLVGSAPLFPLVVLFGLNAVDELDRVAFGILLPDIRDHFGLSNEAALAMVALFTPVAIILGLPIAHYADRLRRTRMAAMGALAWAVFSFMTGLAPAVAVLILARAGSGVGKAVNDPTHNSLLADYYPPEVRGRVYYAHRLANSVGQFTGPMLAGALGHTFGWRVPFIVFAVPTLIFVVLALRLKEPVRGIWDRRAIGADEEAANIEEDPLPFVQAWRLLWGVRSLRRVFYSLPFLSASMIGIAALINLFWEEVYGLNAAQRGLVEGFSEPFQVAGILLGAVVVQRILPVEPARVARAAGMTSITAAAALLVIAVSPNLPVAVAGRVAFSTLVAALIPGIYVLGSMVLPARARALGFSAAGIFGLPGVLALPLAGRLGDLYGLRTGMFVLIPIYVVGSVLIASASRFVAADIHNNRTSTLANARAQQADRADEAGPTTGTT